MTVVPFRRLILGFPNPQAYRPRASIMKKPSKTAAELEASIKVEMEDICDWPTDMAISVQPDGDSWRCGLQVREIFTVLSDGESIRFLIAIQRFAPSRPSHPFMRRCQLSYP